jgi:hypothetical protein
MTEKQHEVWCRIVGTLSDEDLAAAAHSHRESLKCIETEQAKRFGAALKSLWDASPTAPGCSQ